MTKAEFVSSVAKKTGLTKKDAGSVVNVVLETISKTLAKGKKLTFTGFGVFEVRERTACEGRNPRDPGKTIHIPARKVPVFKPGKVLKARVSKENDIYKRPQNV